MLKIRKTLRPELTLLISEMSDDNPVIVDKETGEIADFLAATRGKSLLVEWRGNYPDEVIEVIPRNRYRVNFLADGQMEEVLDFLSDVDEVDLIENPFGSWLKEKAQGYVGRRKATKAFSKRLKAEAALDRAKKDETTALSAIKKSPSQSSARKKMYFVDFVGNGDFHQTTITASNQKEAIKIARRDYKDFSLNSIEETK
jgi:hypothetical protein